MPGPLRPGKFRFCALTVTCSGLREAPGPALMHAPHEGSISSAPARSKISMYPRERAYSLIFCEPNCK